MSDQKEKTNRVLANLEKKYPFLDFNFKDIEEMTLESMIKTRNRMFIFGMTCVILIITILLLTIHSLFTYQEDPNKTFVENFGHFYYYLVSISYYIPMSFVLLFVTNVAWDFFKSN